MKTRISPSGKVLQTVHDGEKPKMFDNLTQHKQPSSPTIKDLHSLSQVGLGNQVRQKMYS